MGEGPKDVRDDAGRFDAPRRDDMAGSGDPDAIGRGVAGAEPMTPATGAYPPGAPPAGSPFGDTAPASRETAASDPTREMAEIRAEIEQKRAEISGTIDEITDRLAPANLVSQASDTVKDTARDTMRRVADTASETAKRVADSASETARRVAGTASETARRMAGTTSETARRVAGTAGVKAGEMAEQSRRVGRTAVRRARENPWSTGAALAGIGAATWWMMSRRSSGTEEWDVDDYSEESLYYDDDELTVDRGNRFVNFVRDNPVPIALTTLGLGWWAWSQRAGRDRVGYDADYPGSAADSTWSTRSGYGAAGADAGGYRHFDSERGVWVGGDESTTDRVKQAAADATDRARERLSNASDRARETMSHLGGRTREAAGRAQQQVGYYTRQATTQLQYWMDRNPLAVGAVAMAVGVAVGLALPETRREQQLMGDARHRMVDNAKALANQAVDRATEAAHNVVGAARNAADTTSSTADSARNVIDRAAQTAKETINKAD
jgi:ElaB/YqjD/DUF883 family membrane-anchored ribosome-binding protein